MICVELRLTIESHSKMKENKVRELFEEFRVVMTGRGNLVDAVLPPLIFLLINAWLGFTAAMWSALVMALLFAGWRLVRRQPLWSALGGVAGVLLAILLVRLLGRAEGFFLPGIVTGAGTAVIAILSILFKRPMVAWTSFISRRWPWDWYWHPKVRPAYTEVTWLWAIYFGLRLLLQLNLFQDASANLLAIFNLILGWPATVLLLIVTYLYGTWRLQNLGGPSVDEFKENAPPPWTSQKRGF